MYRNSDRLVSLIPPYHTTRTKVGLVEITLFNIICDMDLVSHRYIGHRRLVRAWNEPLRVWPGEWKFQ